MQKTTCRPFTLLDAMVLIAALAIAIAISRGFWRQHAELLLRYPVLMTRPRMTYDSFKTITTEIYVFLFCLSWAVFGLVLRKPRPKAAILANSPGFNVLVGLLAATVFSLLETIKLLVVILIQSEYEYLSVKLFEQLFVNCGQFLVFIVVGAWCLLAIRGRSRMARGWLEWSAMALGFAWMAMYFVQLIVEPILGMWL